MYFSGVSTRRVRKVTEELFGLEISSTQVSNLASLLDEELEKFKKNH
jgi:transposase-like protein